MSVAVKATEKLLPSDKEKRRHATKKPDPPEHPPVDMLRTVHARVGPVVIQHGGSQAVNLV